MAAKEVCPLSTPTTHPVPLNAFQRLARDWEKVYPYNAAQALRLRGAADPPAAARAWAQALEATGLGRVAIDVEAGRRFRYEALNGELARYPVQVLPAGTDLAQHMTEELNRPFDDPEEPPFRPFLLPAGPGQGGPASYTLGVVYRHWVADSTAVRLLLREWFVRLHDPAAARDRQLAHPRRGYWALFGPGRSRWPAAATAFNLLRRHWLYRRARKVKTFGPRDYPMRVLLRRAPDGSADRLRTAAKSRGVKVNDLFLAALAQACDKFVPTQERRKRRHLAVATIVDLRPHAGEDLSDTFGLFLGFTEVLCAPGDLRDFDRLTQTVAAQNERHRRRGMPQSSLEWLGAALAARWVVPVDGVYHFYRKETPLVGGVSNVNLNGTWAADYAPGPLIEYVRVSPTGPMVPLVLAVTTLGDSLHLSLTYRPALLSEESAGRMLEDFLQRLE